MTSRRSFFGIVAGAIGAAFVPASNATTVAVIDTAYTNVKQPLLHEGVLRFHSTAWSEMLDAGAFSNFPGFIYRGPSN